LLPARHRLRVRHALPDQLPPGRHAPDHGHLHHRRGRPGQLGAGGRDHPQV